MYAFAIWDKRKQTQLAFEYQFRVSGMYFNSNWQVVSFFVFLTRYVVARDPVGIIPLYIGWPASQLDS